MTDHSRNHKQIKQINRTPSVGDLNSSSISVPSCSYLATKFTIASLARMETDKRKDGTIATLRITAGLKQILNQQRKSCLGR